MSIFAQALRLIIKQLKYKTLIGYRTRGINCCNAEGLTALDIALRDPNAEENGSTPKAWCSVGEDSSLRSAL